MEEWKEYFMENILEYIRRGREKGGKKEKERRTRARKSKPGVGTDKENNRINERWESDRKEWDVK